MRTNLENLLAELLFEEITPEAEKQIKNADPNDIITVYHGTSLSRLPDLINGFDATATRRRDYGGPRHRGLFITPDFEVAKQFGDGTILELKVYAKFIHGTNWSGLIGREEQKEKGKDTFDWVKEKFPNSFRPWMSYTMLSSGSEPQGLLIGVVNPSQITRVWTYDRQTSEYTEHTRDELARSGKVYNATWTTQGSEEHKLHDAGIDLADPKLSLEDFAKALSEFEGGKSPERYMEFFKFYGKLGKDKLKEKLQHIEIGGSKLGRLAIENIVNQVMSRIDESTLSLEPLLEYLLNEGRTQTDEKLEKVLEDWVGHGKRASKGPHWFPPRELFRYREFHRRSRPDLQKSMKAKGFDPKYPIQLVFGKNGVVMVAEGNHRLKTAIQLKIDKVPVEFNFMDKVEKWQTKEDEYNMMKDKERIRQQQAKKRKEAEDRKLGLDSMEDMLQKQREKRKAELAAMSPEEREKEEEKTNKQVEDLMDLLGF